MPPQLSEDEIIEILDEYQEQGEKKKPTSEELGYSRSTVRKYVEEYYDEYKESQDNAIEADEQAGDADDVSPPAHNGTDYTDGAPEGYTAKPPSEDPLRAETGASPEKNVDQDDLRGMTPGEFVDWFFNHQGHGVKEDFKARVVDMCEMRNEIPDREWLQNKILNAASGIGNEGDAEIISETYWVVAQNYMEAKGKPKYSYDGMGGGTWHNPDSQEPARPGESDGGESQGDWVDTDFDGPQRGPSGETNHRGDTGGWDRQRSQPDRQRQQRRQQPGHQRQQPPQFMGNGGGRGDDGPSEEVEKLAEIVREQQKDIERIVDQVSEGGRRQDPSTLADQARELREAKEEMEALTENSNDDELEQVVEHFQEQISDLQRRLATEQDGGGGGGGSGGELQLMMELAQREDMDPEMLQMFGEAVGTTDPEVKKAEFDLRKEEKRAEARKETIDVLFDNLGKVAEQASGAMALFDGGGDDGGQQHPPQGGQPRQPQPAEPEPRPEPEPSQTRERFEELENGSDEIDLSESAERASEGEE